MSHAAESMTERFKANSETNEKVTIECLGNAIKYLAIFVPVVAQHQQEHPSTW